MDRDLISMTFKGITNGNAVEESVGHLRDLVNELGGQGVRLNVTYRRRCDTCGTRSEPGPTFDAVRSATDAAGWVSDPDTGHDQCPDCQRGESS